MMNGDGKLTKKQLHAMGKKLGHDWTEHQLNDMVDKMQGADQHADWDNTVSQHEFDAYMHKVVEADTHKKRDDKLMRLVFLSFDSNKDGIISSQEMGARIRSVGESITAAELAGIMAEAGPGSTNVNLGGFFRLYLGTKGVKLTDVMEVAANQPSY